MREFCYSPILVQNQLSRRKQRDSLRALAGIERADIVVVASPLSGRKQERARRKCFEALLPTLEKSGVEKLVLESRRPGSDRFDLDYVAFAKGSLPLRDSSWADSS